MTSLLLGLLGSLAHAEEPAAETSSQLSFEERVVKGQVAAGSVVLFQRKPRALPGLVPVRRSYREAIVAPLLGDRPQPAESPK